MYIIISFLIIIFIWGFFIEPNLLTVKHYKANFLNGKKIVFVSDFHIGRKDKYRLKKIIDKINKINPDIVLSGGDFIKGHSGKNSMDIKRISEMLSKIRCTFITVLGNHDINFDKYSVKSTLEKYGIIVLDNSSITQGVFSISGVGGKNVSNSQITSALEKAEGIKILISHTPDIYYDVEQKVDLILAGHVHGGQVRLPFFGALICPSKFGTKFSCGDFNETQNRMIVTRGLGTSLMTVRFCDIPEIIVIE